MSTFHRNTFATLFFSVAVLALGCGRPVATMSTDEKLGFADVETAMAEPAAAQALTQGLEQVQPVRFAADNRKIIYRTELDLVVKDFAEFEQAIPALIRGHKGFTAERHTDHTHAHRRGGTWVIRIPVDQYDAFLEGVTAIGFARSRTETADDVTEEFVDIGARVATKRKLEERLVTMVAERTGKLSDVMEIERELARVREEIERMEGRLRLLTDQTSLTTVTVRVIEEAAYEPPTAPTLGDRLANAWGGSLGSIRRLGEGGVILVVALVPWALVLGPLGIVLWWTGKRWRQKPLVA